MEEVNPRTAQRSARPQHVVMGTVITQPKKAVMTRAERMRMDAPQPVRLRRALSVKKMTLSDRPASLCVEMIS